MTDHLLSRQGSDRATAYNISNKLIRREGKLYVGWLDAPNAKGDPVRIRMAVCDGVSGSPEQVFTFGEGKDNHCGPAFTLGPDNRLHRIVGAHHGSFLHSWSDTPEVESSWSEPESIGHRASYPAFAVDGEGTLHLAYRVSGDLWQLHYVRRPAGRPWSAPVIIAESPVPGYNHFMHSLVVGPTGRLHLTFQFHYSEVGGDARSCMGKAACYVTSDDGGATWSHEGAHADLPLRTSAIAPFASYLDSPGDSLRIGTHAIDSHDRPWLFCAMKDRGLVLRRDADGWSSFDLLELLPDLDFSVGKATAVSRDARDRVHFLIATDPAAEAVGWYSPALELFHLCFDPDGTLVSSAQLTEPDPSRAHWLPAIEHTDWLRPGVVGADGHWYLYTAGTNAGLMSQSDYNDTLYTEVHLSRLPA